MHPVSFARATNRRVLGSMNDFAFQASHHLARGEDLATIAVRLADTPMSAIGERPGHLGFPDMLVRALLVGRRRLMGSVWFCGDRVHTILPVVRTRISTRGE